MTPGDLARERELMSTRLAVATSAAGLGLWDWDLETDDLVWDARSIDIYGLTGQQLSGKVDDIARGIHPDDLPAVNAALEEVIAAAGRLDLEFRVVWGDGTVRWVSALGQVLVAPDGRPVRMIGTNADVTDAREAVRQQYADAERMAGLTAVARSLGNAVAVEDVVAVVARHGAGVFGAAGVVLCLANPGEETVSSFTSEFFGEQVSTQVAQLPLDFPLPMVDSAVTGRAHFLADRDEAAATFPGGLPLWVESGTRAAASVPLAGPAGLIGSLSLGFDRGHEWREADRELLHALASLAEQAVQRIRTAAAAAESAEAVARLAETLQRSLLTAPPEPDHLHVVPRYLPAAAEAQVGGDWYDAFLGPDGATHLVIGDVTGHDGEAAATMAQLRNVLRGIAWTSGGTPAQVLTTLDRAVTGLAIGTLATVIVARVEQGAGDRVSGRRTLRWSNAGHPAPLLVDASGQVVLLEDHDLLLGVDHDHERHDHTVVLEPGSTLLLHTDGLVERHGADLDTGTARLAATVGALVRAGATLDELCDQVLADLPERPEDDVALIALRAHPEDEPRPAEAGPVSVPDLPVGDG